MYHYKPLSKRSDSPFGIIDDADFTYFDNRAIAAPPADVESHGPAVSCAPLKSCRKCGGPLRKAKAASTCDACFAEMQARAERQEEIV